MAAERGDIFKVSHLLGSGVRADNQSRGHGSVLGWAALHCHYATTVVVASRPEVHHALSANPVNCVGQVLVLWVQGGGMGR